MHLASSLGRRRPALAAVTAVAAFVIAAPGCAEDPAPPTSSPGSSASVAKDAEYRLSKDGAALVDSSGRRIPINGKLAIGYADAAARTGDYVDLSGWAAPTELNRPADLVVAVVGKKSVAAASPSRERPDLVEGYNRPGLLRSGFVVSVPISGLKCAKKNGGLVLYGVAGDAAVRLKWLSDVHERVASACA
jgi:hypothetical protein